MVSQRRRATATRILVAGALLLTGIGRDHDAARANPAPVRSRGPAVRIEKGIRVRDGGSPGVYVFRKKLIRMYLNSPGVLGVGVIKTRNGKKFRGLRTTGVSVADSITADPSIVLFQDKLRMYFRVSPLDNQDSHKVWRATASNKSGTRWQIDGLAFEDVKKPCFDWTSVPHAVVTAQDQVRVYFVCDKSLVQIASALSSDGMNFAFEQVVLEGGVDPYVLRLDDGTYRIFYAAPSDPPGGGMFNTIRTAISQDGLVWTGHQQLLAAEELGVDSTIDPAAYPLKKGKFRVYVATQRFEGGETILNIYSLRFDPSGAARSPW